MPATTDMAPTKSALITGCSEGGIGHALAEEFARDANMHVFATARAVSQMASLAHLPNMTLLALDVTSQPSIQEAVAAVAEATGGTLDYLVNNAGCQYVSPVLDLDVELARRMYDVNFWGVFAVTQAFAPLVVAARGSIANLSSVGTLLSLPYIVTYASSKAACEVFSEGLRRELAPLGVKVVTVIVGGVKTNIHSNQPKLTLPDDSFYRPVAKQIADRASGQGDEAYMGPPEDFARGLVRNLVSGASGKVYRGKMSSLAIIVKFFPTWLLDRLAAMGSGLDILKEIAQSTENFQE